MFAGLFFGAIGLQDGKLLCWMVKPQRWGRFCLPTGRLSFCKFLHTRLQCPSLCPFRRLDQDKSTTGSSCSLDLRVSYPATGAILPNVLRLFAVSENWRLVSPSLDQTLDPTRLRMCEHFAATFLPCGEPCTLCRYQCQVDRKPSTERFPGSEDLTPRPGEGPKDLCTNFLQRFREFWPSPKSPVKARTHRSDDAQRNVWTEKSSHLSTTQQNSYPHLAPKCGPHFWCWNFGDRGPRSRYINLKSFAPCKCHPLWSFLHDQKSPSRRGTKKLNIPFKLKCLTLQTQQKNLLCLWRTENDPCLQIRVLLHFGVEIARKKIFSSSKAGSLATVQKTLWPGTRLKLKRPFSLKLSNLVGR